jgi:hypothetical protein
MRRLYAVVSQRSSQLSIKRQSAVGAVDGTDTKFNFIEQSNCFQPVTVAEAVQ